MKKINANKQLKFVIVGHVDHGKSTFIGRLLHDTNSLSPDRMEEVRKASEGLGRDTEFAYLLDHLEEERQQGITIDTTQVFFKSLLRDYVIIDAPGHVEFVKNMITGASQAEAALLIIDVAEGIQEQTKRHAYLLSLLGIKNIIVIMNKMDLVNYDAKKFNSLIGEALKFLEGIGIRPKEWIPVSALKGDNIAKRSFAMSWYKGPSVIEALDDLPSSSSDIEKSLIFPVQDIYRIGDRRIYVGRVESGRISKDEKIKVLPSGQRTVVKSIEKFCEEPIFAGASECVGITTTTPAFIDRGDIISSGKEPIVTDVVKADLFWLSKKPFSKDEKLAFRCATQEVSCRVEHISRRINSSTLELIEEDASGLSYLEAAEVTMRTKKPIVITTFLELEELGRFVLSRDGNICAGGIIKDSLQDGERG